MLRTIRKYQKSVLGIIAIGLVALAMSGFGMNLLNQRKEPYAVKVGKTEIPYARIASERRNVEDNYRQILGAAYQQLFKTLSQELPQQVVDQVVDREVLEQAAQKSGLYAGDDQVRSYIYQQIFPNGFNNDQYTALLQRQGVDARQFETNIRHEIERDQLTQLTSLAALPSDYEANMALQKEEQSYDVKSVTLDASAFIKTAAEPTSDAIKTYYENNSTTFESPAKAAYDYAEFKPELFESKVEVNQEDIEIEFSDNPKRYTSPAEINVRHIQFNVAADADAATKDKVKETANEVLNKLKSGEDFATLAKQYSKDTGTSLIGGSLGWIKRGKMNPAFDKAAFELASGALSEVVEAPYGFHIIKVDDKHDAKLKPLDEVKAEIDTLIRKREAPALAASLAESYGEEFKKSTLSLREFLKGKELDGAVVSQPLSSEIETPAGLNGLTKAVLSLDSERGVAELKDSVLIQVIEKKEAALKPLSEVTADITSVLKAQAATAALQAKAIEVSAKIADGSYKTIADVATATGSEAVITEKAKLREQTSGVLSEAAAKQAVGGVSTVPTLLKQSFTSDGKVFFLEVERIAQPEAKDLATKSTEQKERISQQLAQNLTRELSEKYKSETEIDIKPEALR